MCVTNRVRTNHCESELVLFMLAKRRAKFDKLLILNFLSTSSLISPSFQGDPTIFHKGIFLKQTPHIKN